ncbi:hypothetical protein [Sphingomonas sp. SRS2]|uniref:hypothetical protein n=1 Tax=Sphingomonas sp. SRS2 TaxID=133190 RepID=UPI000618479C|nr:hypothetical protein [Sphingomonas sp. SRS2]KKC27450.1 hypothetical protein WP12_03490 [Sphingomonas sp. SRS2]
MNATKGPFASLTVWSSAGAAIVSGLSAFGIDLGPDGANQINAIVAGVLATVAIYGRIRASRRIATGV